MGLMFNDGNDNKPEDKGNDDDLMERLRNLVNNNKDKSQDQLKSMLTPENLELANRVEERISVLVDAAHAFLKARKGEGDPAKAIMDFMRIVQDTCLKYNVIELSSIIATGMTAVATLERAAQAEDEQDNEN